MGVDGSTCPDSSSRKSSRVMRRAIGVLPFRSFPDDERWSPACATSARRSPSGDQWTLPTPCFTRGQSPRLPAVEGQDPCLRYRVVVLDVAHERHVAAVGRDGWRAVVDAPAGQLPSAPAAQRTQPQVGLVVATADPAQDVHDGRAVAEKTEGFEGDLGANERRSGCIGHAAEYARIPDRAADR